MNALALTDRTKMVAILNTFSWLDDIRWDTTENYNSINYAHPDLTADEKLLTHWLCYIMNRQMAYKPVFDVGGYVISDLVRTYTRHPRQLVRDLLDKYLRIEGNSWRLTCAIHAPNAILDRYGMAKEASFASRYMPDDLVRKYRTLETLASFSKRSLARFLVTTTDWTQERWQVIRRIAHSLNQLTYAGVGNVSEKKFKAALNKAAKQAQNFQVVESTHTLFDRKRLWCTVRDYLKSKEFNQLFVEALAKAGKKDASQWKSDSPGLKRALAAIELPGDVWNNASLFRSGLFSPYLANERPSWKMPRTIRKIYELLARDTTLQFYPEQLDVSFDFVPRMCERTMCDVCIFGKGIGSLCHRTSDLLCPVVLVACGYRHKCNPTACPMQGDLVKGLCHNAAASADTLAQR